MKMIKKYLNVKYIGQNSMKIFIVFLILMTAVVYVNLNNLRF